jgi:hypothetical protein
MTANGNRTPPTGMTYCAKWLSDELRRGPRSKPDITLAAQAVGFTVKQLRTAREQLGVRSQRRGFGRDSAALWAARGQPTCSRAICAQGFGGA